MSDQHAVTEALLAFRGDINALDEQIVRLLGRVEDVDEIDPSHLGVVNELRQLRLHELETPIERNHDRYVRGFRHHSVLGESRNPDLVHQPGLQLVEGWPQVVAE